MTMLDAIAGAAAATATAGTDQAAPLVKLLRDTFTFSAPTAL